MLYETVITYLLFLLYLLLAAFVGYLLLHRSRFAAQVSNTKTAEPKKFQPGKMANKQAKTTTSKQNSTTAREAIQAHGLKSALGGNADDLKAIKGIGPKLEKTLNALGIFHFEQIANWNGQDVAEVDELLKFKGRIKREKWISQAKQLMA